MICVQASTTAEVENLEISNDPVKVGQAYEMFTGDHIIIFYKTKTQI
jgi:hypothetical protein